MFVRHEDNGMGLRTDRQEVVVVRGRAVWMRTAD